MWLLSDVRRYAVWSNYLGIFVDGRLVANILRLVGVTQSGQCLEVILIRWAYKDMVRYVLVMGQSDKNIKYHHSPQLAIITVLAFPPSEFCNSRVRLDSLYGTWVAPWRVETRALMTLPSTVSE